MSDPTPAIVLVEPQPSGHRFQTVAMLAEQVEHPIVLLTSHGATADPAFAEFLTGVDLTVEEVFDGVVPPTQQIAREVARRARRGDVALAVVLDADQALKRWWLDAPRAFGLRRRPRVVFMLTRYPAQLRATDWVGWRLRVPKVALALAAMASGTLHRVAGFAGRDDLSRGWVVKRTRDPALSLAHARDRAVIRERHGLASDRALVSICGGVSERKHPELVWEAMQAAGIDADLLLCGGLSEGVARWAAGVAPTAHGSLVLRPGFLPSLALDELVAASDTVALVMTNNGPSGIMGKALAAGVPVVTAGSTVRAKEAAATGGGESADMTPASIGAGLRRALARGGLAPSSIPVPTPASYIADMLGPGWTRPGAPGAVWNAPEASA